MNSWRKTLKPLSWLYKGVTGTRNALYNKGIITSHEFDTPLIVVGNLRVGGTGKTPMVSYLVQLLKEPYKVAVLSRGYKRKSTGYVLADKEATAQSIGDEPYQLWRKFPDITIAVDADRTHGIHQLEVLPKPPEIILLDDAFQHRKVKADFNILLTPYHDLYTEDELLPVGNLRESVGGADRAQVIVVTKCPTDLTTEQEFETARRLQVGLHQTVFFSKIQYAEYVQNETGKINVKDLKNYGVVLVTGIAEPEPLLAFLTSIDIDYTHLAYPDHHHFSKGDIEKIKDIYQQLSQTNKIILTTEKDYVRIFDNLPNLYYLGIETVFINHQKDFDKLIIDYVEQSSGNRKLLKRQGD
jgi:tetraacyldisaccharide 4'-kinase